VKILVCDKIAQEGIDELKKAGDVVVATGLDEAQLIEAAADAAAIVVRSATRITAPIIEAAKGLRIIGRAGVGVDNIDVEAATAHGVVVVNSPGGNVIAAAEHTIALMLSAARRIPLAHGEMLKRNWAKSEGMGVEIRDKVCGVIGLGRIGREVAARARGLKLNVIGYDPALSAEHVRRIGVEPVSLDELLRTADFITCHVPGGEPTRHLIDAEGIAKMKKTAIVVNCSRGGVVDEAALAQALHEKRLGGAAIDVFEGEPKPWDSPLIDAPGIVLTPHLGASTAEAQVVAATDVARQVVSVLAGGQADSAVNLPRIPDEAAEELKPWLALAERQGKLVGHLASAGLKSVTVEYLGNLCDLDCSLLARAVMVGILAPLEDPSINLVSAPMLAMDRGVKVTESKVGVATPYHSVLRVLAESDTGGVSTSATLRGLDEPRIVMLEGYRVDFVPRGTVMFVWYHDQPGVIGRIGTVLGESGNNIGEMHVGRTEVGGIALMILNIDSQVRPEAQARVRELPMVESLRVLELG
jgi:D-3-phosphoglycerate dehydrogenase / 2-oxoglutarate reductase